MSSEKKNVTLQFRVPLRVYFSLPCFMSDHIYDSESSAGPDLAGNGKTAENEACFKQDLYAHYMNVQYLKA